MRHETTLQNRRKNGVALEELEGHFTDNWQGKVMDIYEEEGTVLIQFDAQTLDALTDEYLKSSVEEGDSCEEYYFYYHDLEPAPVPRRDTDSMFEKALQKVETRCAPFYEDEDEYDEEEYGEDEIEQLIAQWEESPHFSALSEDVQGMGGFGVKVFADYAYQYEGIGLEDWTVDTVEDICTDPIPRKVSDSTENIGLIADALAAFFDWMHLNALHPKAKQMRDAVKKVKPQMLKIAADPRQWGMAKSMIMGAMEAGVDMNTLGAFDDYLAQMPKQSFNGISAASQPRTSTPARENPYKNLSRNEVITVRYENGTEKTGKFKRLEEDLRSGKCKLV